jgi:hypothetical protein
MIPRIDLIIGGVRAAELINQYRSRLREQDMLPDGAALKVACSAFADGNAYVLAAPGQVWEEIPGDSLHPNQVIIAKIEILPGLGHCATGSEPCGVDRHVPLDELDAHYALVRWDLDPPAAV